MFLGLILLVAVLCFGLGFSGTVKGNWLRDLILLGIGIALVIHSQL